MLCWKGWRGGKEFIAQALAELERIEQELEKYRNTTAEMMATNLSLRWTVEMGLLAGLSIIFRVADHILTHAFRRSVPTYEGLLSELRTVGVISDSLHSLLQGAGGFRNVLVYEYLDIDLREVAAVLQKAPDAFRTFKDEVSAWVRTLREEG